MWRTRRCLPDYFLVTDIHHLIESGSAHVWLYIPVAILLGALHGLEPGHSKTMMAAFIIAIRGTIWQAVLLGLSAAISHSLIIWVLAALALKYGSSWNAESTEPYFHLASAAMILGLAIWMFLRTRREVAEAAAHAHGHEHGHHHHDHSHGHHDEEEHEHEFVSPAPLVTATRNAAGEVVTAGGLILPSGSDIASSLTVPDSAKPREPKAPEGVIIDTGHGWLKVCICEDGVPPHLRIYPCKADGKPAPMSRATMSIETTRLDGSTQKFQFEAKSDHWQSTATLPEPHEFAAVLTMGHGDHAHTYRLRFHEHDHGDHSHVIAEVEQPKDEYQDAHERAHAEDIARRFANRAVTTPQIVMFGITGGLMPCPAAFTILLVCLQVKRVTLGVSLVAAFSFGLALTMVFVGVIAAWSVQKAQKRFSGFGEWMRRAPYISCALLVVLAAVMAWQGWQGLQHGHAH